jgi:hypothetical protein
MIPAKSAVESDYYGRSFTTPPIELYTAERIAEFERESSLDAGRHASGLEI